MHRVELSIVAIATMIIGCSSRSDAPQPPPAQTAARDGGVDGATPAPDPSATHVDDDVPRPISRPVPARPGRPIDVTLRSSPPGAIAAVDGVQVGTTPAFWSGEANGREREFTFTLAGYASARYRFVPVTSGVIHARLEAIAEEPDAGVGAEIAPQAPDALPPAAPPAPADAAAPRTQPDPPIDGSTAPGPQP